MRSPSPLRPPNPRLGAYYGIFTSAFVCLVVLLAIFEQLGVKRLWLSHAMILIPILAYVLIAVGARSVLPEDFFTSGRRVPPVFSGMAMAVTLLGSVALFAYTGTLYFLGFDALAIALGWVAGLLFAGVLFLPYLRKAGSYTLPSFLGQRYASHYVQLAACVLLLPPLLLLIAAELKLAALIAALFIAVSYETALLVIAVSAAGIAALGGMRSLTWAQCAQFIVALIGILLPLAVVSILLTNLPAPQLTYGELAGRLASLEIAAGIGPTEPRPLAEALPGSEAAPSIKPFLQAFGGLRPADFFALFLCLTLGAAALPSLLMRGGTTVSVAEKRRASAWGLVLASVFLLSAPAYAAFVKYQVLHDIAQSGMLAQPPWLAALSAADLARFQDADGNALIGASELLMARDGVTIALPVVSQLPFVLTVLLATAGIAIALAAAAAHLFALGASSIEDAYRILIDPDPGTQKQLLFARYAIGGVAVLAFILLLVTDIDILQAAIMAFALAGASFFPLLLLSVWWEKSSEWGALAAMGTGFAIAALAIAIGGQVSTLMLVATLLGTLAGLAAGVGASLFGPPVSPEALQYFEQLRTPGNETLYDRSLKRAAIEAERQAEASEPLESQEPAPQA
jgi:cation/acetate symporter